MIKDLTKTCVYVCTVLLFQFDCIIQSAEYGILNEILRVWTNRTMVCSQPRSVISLSLK